MGLFATTGFEDVDVAEAGVALTGVSAGDLSGNPNRNARSRRLSSSDLAIALSVALPTALLTALAGAEDAGLTVLIGSGTAFLRGDAGLTGDFVKFTAPVSVGTWIFSHSCG